MLEDVLKRVHERLEAVGLSASAASVKAGLSKDAVRNMERAVDKDDRTGVSTKTITALAPVLGTSAGWLLTGEGQSERSNTVAVMGRIGAGAEIGPDDEQIPPEGLYEIEAPFPVPDDSIAFEVVGESMWPRYDPGDIIICWATQSHVEEVVGWEAAVRLADGRRFLKRILRGATKSTFDLESHNAAPIRGVHIDWVGAIQAVIRSGQWRKLNEDGKRRMLRKMAS
jgi:phage repressor protein C with HTH and peptisase S24 domain